MAFAREGARIAVVDRLRLDQADRQERDLRRTGASDVMFAEADVTASGPVAQMVERIANQWGRIDVLVNAAGINKWVAFNDLDGLTEELWETLVRTNLTGPWLVSKAVAPIMKRGGRGRIINVVSTAGFSPSGSSVAYAVAKAGLAHLTRCLAVALRPEILVNGVSPGLMRETNMGQLATEEQAEAYREQTALGRSVDIDDVAKQIIAFAQSNSTTGQNLIVDCGFVYR
jgi:3-oxoacyl-[acyl-carrier protein] reductase